MFKSQRVACYLNSFGGHGDDPENKELKLIFHVSPITQELASEISPQLADRLFRREADRWEPAREITKASFSSLQIEMQNLTVHSLGEAQFGESAVVIPGAAISNLRAARAFAESSEFRLEFDVVIPMDRSTMRLVEQFYKSICFLTMEPIQRKLEDQPEDPAKVALGNSLQDAADSGGTPKRGKRGKGKAAAAGDEVPEEQLA